jgi:dCTP deaminase
MMLSDRTYAALIRAGDILVSPLPTAGQCQPVSLDLLLGNSFCRLPRNQFDEHHRIISDENIIRPGEFLLANTQERIKLPIHIAGVVHGKSTWARRGLMVEAAGLVDPGFDGTITLELKNLSDLPIPLTAGQAICQISFHAIDTAVLRPYGSAGLNSHYQGQTSAEPARD